MTRSIGILKTDSVLPAFQEAFGDYPEMFEACFREVGSDVAFTTIDARQFEEAHLPDPCAFDAYLITGSRQSVYDDEPWIEALAVFVRRAIEARRKILAICFGHQLVAHFFGGRVEAAANGWAVGRHESQIVSTEPWMDGAKTLALISSHQDQVVELPADARVYATNDFCPVAGFTMGEHVLAVQGHPEFSRDYSRALMGMRRELIGESVYQRGVESLTEETDAVRFTRWMVNFLNGSE